MSRFCLEPRALLRPALLSWSAFAGSLLSCPAAWADQATGCTPSTPASNGTIMCTSAGNTYATGIHYDPTGPITITVEPGVIVTGTYQHDIRGYGISGGFNTPNDVTINNSGDVLLPKVNEDGIQTISAGHTLAINNSGQITASLGIHALADATAGSSSVFIANSGPINSIGGITASSSSTTV
jgi:hypothetical protein